MRRPAGRILARHKAYRIFPFRALPPRGLASPPPKLCGPISASVGLCGRLIGNLVRAPYLRAATKTPASASISLLPCKGIPRDGEFDRLQASEFIAIARGAFTGYRL